MSFSSADVAAADAAASMPSVYTRVAVEGRAVYNLAQLRRTLS